MIDAEAFHHLGIALALGLAVGVERGWQQREATEGTRVAGVRTFALSGLLGGVAQVLAAEWQAPWLLASVLAAYTALISVAYVMTARAQKGFGLTTEVAGVLVFLLAALAAAGRPLLAAAATVAMLVVLRAKAALHGWVARLQSAELRAGITLALLSVVALPLLPREPVDPWGVVSLYEIWWMVVLVAGLSFAGYAAVRVAGVRRGLLLTAVFGALASSTAVTLTFARLSRESPTLRRIFAACIVGACSVMPLRVAVVCGAVNPGLLPSLLWPLLAIALVGGAAVVVLARGRGATVPTEAPVALRNPLELGTALKLGVAIALVLLLGEGLRRWMGEPGLYLLAGVSGLTDMDAITLSLSRLARGGGVEPDVAAQGILLAAATSTAFKTGLAFAVGGRALGRLVGVPLGLALLSGAAALWLGSRLAT